VKAQLASLSDGPVKTALTEVLTDTTKRLDDTLNFAGRWEKQTAAQIKAVYENFEFRFNIGQERAQEWFATHARIITTVLGLVFALVLQLDTIEIFKLVSTNRAVRDKLVAQTSRVLAQADKALGTDQQVQAAALDQWKKGLQGPVLAAAQPIQAVAGETREKLLDRAKSVLKSALKEQLDDEQTKALSGLDKAITASVKGALEQSVGDYKLAKADLDGTGFQLFPDNGHRWPAESDGYLNHLFGMLLSALLLSLGAPFWFNLLTGLASLRSRVAENISDETKTDLKNNTRKKSGTPPPTA
jgi:hypothetical protein